VRVNGQMGKWANEQSAGNDGLARVFEEHRGHLRSVAYRMLGSFSEADDAVQETWLRLSRADRSDVENMRAWLTTVTSRVCLNMLQSRKVRREEPFELHMPDPVVSPMSGTTPEQEALLADSVGLALMVVLEMLPPAERLAFVLHDVFALPFEEIAPILDRTPTAARQLASRARRRVHGSPSVPDVDIPAQREVVDAFFNAARKGDFRGLLAVLDPEVVLRSDGGALRRGASAVLHGAEVVASNAMMFSKLAPYAQPALINGVAGVVVAPNGNPYSVLAFTVRGGKIVAIDALVDSKRLAELDLRL